MLILKFHPRMKCLHVFFSFFHPRMKFHPCLSFRDEISSRQKRVNSKRHVTIDRDDFIPGWNFTCKHPLNDSIRGNRELVFAVNKSTLKVQSSISLCNTFFGFLWQNKICIIRKNKKSFRELRKNLLKEPNQKSMVELFCKNSDF